MKFSIITQINHFLLVILFYFEVTVSPSFLILNGVELKIGAVNNFHWFHQMIFLMVLI